MKPILETDKEFICDIQASCVQMLSPEEADLVRVSKTQALFRKADNLTKQGAFASYAMFVIKGLAKQYIKGDGTKNHNLRIIQPGEFVGLSAVFTKNTFNYSSVALTECQVFLVEKEAIKAVIKHNGEFGFIMIRGYYEQNANLFDTLRTMLCKQMNGRMAETLLYLETLKFQYPDIFRFLSRKDIAYFAGISTESAMKLRKSFEKDGLIELHKKEILLLNYEELQEISKKG